MRRTSMSSSDRRASAGTASCQVSEMGDQRRQEPSGDPWPTLAYQRAAKRKQQEDPRKQAGGNLAQAHAAPGLAAVNGNEHGLQEHRRENEVNHMAGVKQILHDL